MMEEMGAGSTWGAALLSVLIVAAIIARGRSRLQERRDAPANDGRGELPPPIQTGGATIVVTDGDVVDVLGWLMGPRCWS